MDVSNISNWGSLTASQILAYEEEGAEVPDEYLAWAESVGATFAQTYNETASAASTITSTASEINEASQFREALAKQGVSLKDLAQIFTNESTLQQQKLETAESTLSTLTAQSKVAGAEVMTTVDEAKAKLDELNAKLEAAKNRLAAATTDQEKADAQAEIDSLSGEIATISASASTKVDTKSNILSSIGDKILKVFDMAVNSKEIGDETMGIAVDLNYKVAKNTKKQSTLVSAGIGGAIGTAVGFGAVAAGLIPGGIAVVAIALLGAGIGLMINLFSGKEDKGANYDEAKVAYDAGSELNNVATKVKSEAQATASANNITINESKSSKIGSTSAVSNAEPSVDTMPKLNETDPKKKL